MPSINKCIVFLSLALSVTALGSGHEVRSHHRGMMRQLVDRSPRPEVYHEVPRTLKNRGSTRTNTKRCKASADQASSAAAAAASSSSAKAEKSAELKKAEAKPTPSPTSEKKEEPKPTSSKKEEADPKPTKSSGGGGGLQKGGIATFFSQNGVAGACGKVHQDSDIVCALETSTFAGGSKCGQSVSITNAKNGKTISVLVADECPTCDNSQSIDLSNGAYKALGGTVDEGVFPIEWKFE